MILWELRKIIKSKFLIISLMLIIAIFIYHNKTNVIPEDIENVVSMNLFFEELYHNQEEYDNYALQYYEELDGKGLAQILTLEGVYLDRAYMDYMVIGELKNKKQYAQRGYEELMTDIVRTTTVYMCKSNSLYEKRLHEKSIEIYNTRVDIEPVYEKGLERYLTWIQNEPIVGMVLILWCVVLAAQVVGFEERKNLKLMVATTKRGRRDILLSKIAAIAIIVAVVKFMFIMVNIIFGLTVYRINFRMFLAPIQSLERYQLCSFHVSILGYFMLVGLGQLVLLELAVCVTAVMAYFIKPVPAAGISLVLWEAPVYLLSRQTWDTYLEMETFGKIRQYAPWALNSIRDYFLNFDYGRFINFPVNRFVTCIIVSVLVMALCVGMIYAFAERNNRRMSHGISSKGN